MVTEDENSLWVLSQSLLIARSRERGLISVTTFLSDHLKRKTVEKLSIRTFKIVHRLLYYHDQQFCPSNKKQPTTSVEPIDRTKNRTTPHLPPNHHPSIAQNNQRMPKTTNTQCKTLLKNHTLNHELKLWTSKKEK